MKRYFCFILLIFVALLTYRCDKESDPDEPEETTNKVEVYYSYEATNRELLSDGDTITIGLTDTFSLDVDISDTSKVLDYLIGNTDPFDFNDEGDYQYQFTTYKCGVFGITVFVNFRRAEIDYSFTTFYVKIPTIDYTIISLETPVSTIDVEDDNLKNQIQTELDENYILNMRPLVLTCNTVTSGTYQLKTLQGETGTGIFTTTNARNVVDLTLLHNNLTYSYSLTQESETDKNIYQFRQDLTEEFRAKYPEKIINEVTLLFKGLRGKGKPY